MRRSQDGMFGALLRCAERSVDRLPKAAALRKNEYGRTVALALQMLLPQRSAAERESILRGVVRHRLIDRAIQVFHTSAPAVAVAVARCIPVRVEAGVAATIRDGAIPLILATGHFGPLFFQALVLRRYLNRRRVIVVLHGRALYLRTVQPFLRRVGYEPLIDDGALLSKLRRALRDEPRTVILVVFDHMQHGRRAVPFLHGTITTSNSIGLLAEIGQTRVITSYWEWQRGQPRVELAGPYAIDRTLPPLERRRRFLNLLFAGLEAKVAAHPDQWSGWYFVAPRLSVAPSRETAS